MKRESDYENDMAFRHYSEKGGHYERGRHRKDQIKALKLEHELRKKGEIFPIAQSRLVGSDVLVFEP